MINDNNPVIDPPNPPSNPMDAPISKPEAYAYLPLVAITLIAVLAAQVMRHSYNVTFMGPFMAFWLIQFALVKLFDLQGFVEMFARYDVVSQRVRAYGYLYPFIELSLGLSYLGNFFPFATSVVLLAISALGLLNVVLHRQRNTVYCACMGSVAKVPLGRVAIIENLLMIVMACMHLAKHMNFGDNVPM